MTAIPFLQANSVSKIYPGKQQGGVKTTSLTIDQGKITAFIGASGSGKSTLLKLLYGLLSPDTGQVLFKGERIWGPEEQLIPGHDAMKMVTQQTDDLNLFAKVWDNISVLLPNTDLAAKHNRTEEVLVQLNMMQLADKRVADLSGGERQRVAIARALATLPEVLLLDEPFNQVDATFREGLQEDIRRVVRITGLTVIIVSHDPAEVLSMADTLMVIRDGEIVESGNPRDLYQQPKNLYTARLLSNCNVLNKEQAVICNINAGKDNVVIYPEWIEITQSWTHQNWQVEQILFKGYYEDIILKNSDVQLRVLNTEPGKYKEGDHLHLKIKNHLGY